MKNPILLSSFVLTSLISIARPHGLTPGPADSHEATLPAVAIPGNTSQSAGGGCSEASLDGPYESTFSGFGNPGRDGTATGNAGKVPSAAVGLVYFDGHGNVTTTFTFAEGGNVSTTSPTSPETGTYTVKGDCTAVIYDTTRGTQYNMVLIGGGTEMFGVLANYTPALLELKKQNVPAAGCSNAVLAGN